MAGFGGDESGAWESPEKKKQQAARKAAAKWFGYEGDSGSSGAAPPAQGPPAQGPPPATAAGSPRTFEIIQREKARTAGTGLLRAFDEAQRQRERTASIGFHEGVRGTPTGSGLRSAAARHLSREAAAPQADLILQQAMAAKTLADEERALGSERDDILLGMKAIDDHIAWMMEADFTPHARKAALRARLEVPGLHPDIKAYILYKLHEGPAPGSTA